MQNPGKTRVGALCLRHETRGKKGGSTAGWQWRGWARRRDEMEDWYFCNASLD